VVDGVRAVWMPGGVRTEIHLDADDTAGAFCLLVDRPPAGWSLPSHRHLHEAETIHIVEGEFEVVRDGISHHLSAGETIHIPRGVMHASANLGENQGRRVLMFSPAGLERFFLEAGAPAADVEVDGAAALAAALRHGWEFAARG
jgi:mannose-6-phosphate isomerase-like protein (cupin superfamily)